MIGKAGKAGEAVPMLALLVVGVGGVISGPLFTEVPESSGSDSVLGLVFSS